MSAGADATRALSDSALWIRELEAGGWTRLGTSGTVWRSPDGQYYRGPFGAWRVMHGALLPEPLGFAARVMMLASVVENAGVETVIGLRADEQADLREAAALLRRLAAAPANAGDAAYRLAMLALQERAPRRYDTDPEFQEAVRDVLERSEPLAALGRARPEPEGG